VFQTPDLKALKQKKPFKLSNNKLPTSYQQVTNKLPVSKTEFHYNGDNESYKMIWKWFYSQYLLLFSLKADPRETASNKYA